MKNTKLLAVLVAMAFTSFGALNITFAANGEGAMGGSGDQIQLKTYSGENLSGTIQNGSGLQESRSTQLRQKIGTHANMVDSVMNQFANKYANEETVTKLQRYESLKDKVTLIERSIDGLKVTEEKKLLYKETFEYLGLQIQETIDTLE